MNHCNNLLGEVAAETNEYKGKTKTCEILRILTYKTTKKHTFLFLSRAHPMIFEYFRNPCYNKNTYIRQVQYFSLCFLIENEKCYITTYLSPEQILSDTLKTISEWYISGNTHEGIEIIGHVENGAVSICIKTK